MPKSHLKGTTRRSQERECHIRTSDDWQLHSTLTVLRVKNCLPGVYIVVCAPACRRLLCAHTKTCCASAPAYTTPRPTASTASKHIDVSLSVGCCTQATCTESRPESTSSLPGAHHTILLSVGVALCGSWMMNCSRPHMPRHTADDSVRL